MCIPKEIDTLKNDLLWAYYDLEEYKNIYCKDQNDLDILNETALNFFVKLKEYLWERIILAISRFIDSSIQHGFYNLSLDSLKDIAKAADLPFFDDLVSQINSIQNLVIPFKTYRSKLIAHRDLKYATSDDLKPETIYIEQVEEIFSKIGTCINYFYEYFEHSSWHFQDSAKIRGAQSLFYFLRQGAIYVDMKLRRNDYSLDLKEEKESKYYNNSLTSS